MPERAERETSMIERHGRHMIEILKVSRPDVAVTVIRTENPHCLWDGDEPIDQNVFTCYDHEVRATTICNGELVSASDYLGGSWYDVDDMNADNQACIAEISGYLPQMIDDALDALDALLREHA